MPKTTKSVKSPYATAFQSAIRRGIPAGEAVTAISRRHNKAAQIIFGSLYKAGLVQRRRIDGQWIYWPVQKLARSASAVRLSRARLWQSVIDVCIADGSCGPEQVQAITGDQPFAAFIRQIATKEIGSARGGSAAKATGRAASAYLFPRTARTVERTATRRYRRAA